MLLVSVLSSKSLSADFARKRPRPCMYPHVFLQRVVTAKSLSTDLTNSSFFSQMQLRVILERLARSKLAFADCACKRSLIMRVRQVFFQSESIAISLAAYIAHGLAFSAVYTLYVHVEIALHLELLAASLAAESIVLGVLANTVLAQRLSTLEHAAALGANESRQRAVSL